MQQIDEKEILILGLGTSGMAAAELALNRGAAVTVLDTRSRKELQERADVLRERGAVVALEWHEESVACAPDLAIISPGIHPESLLGDIAASLVCPVISELEYGFRYCSCPLIAVTGTNGKTTTVELITHCLRHSGRNVLAAGNIGRPLCETVRRSAVLDYLVVEVSSFQLERVDQFAPLVAVLLNITPDHLDRYAGMAEYTTAKLNILKNMKKADRIVLRQDLCENEAVQQALPAVDTPLVFCSTESLLADYCVTADGNLCRRGRQTMQKLLNRADLKLEGDHNMENVLATLATAEAIGIDPLQFVPHVKTFVPIAHRLELVALHNNVRFINDSKATNLDAMLRGLQATAAKTRGKILLIAGGLAKGVDFTSAIPILTQTVREALLIGKCREQLAEQWEAKISCKKFASLAAAVDAAVEAAQPGDTVLLAPGCASQDMFVDYAERGHEFCSLVKRRFGE